MSVRKSRNEFLTGGIVAAVIVAFVVGLLGFLSNPEFVRPAVSALSCGDGAELTTNVREYSYKPGQAGVEIKHLCCGDDGECQPANAAVLLAVYLLLALLPSVVLCLPVALAVGTVNERYRWGSKALVGIAVVIAAVLVVLLMPYGC